MVNVDDAIAARDAIEGHSEEAVIAVLIHRFLRAKGTPMEALAYAVCVGLLKESLVWLSDMNAKPPESAE